MLKAYATHISVFPWRKLHCTGFAVHYFRQQSMLAISVLWRRKKNSTRYESATLFCYTTMETEVNRESRRPPTTKTDREYWQMDMCSRNFRGGCGWVGGSSIGRTKIASELYKALEEYTAYVTACKTGSNYKLDSDRLTAKRVISTGHNCQPGILRILQQMSWTSLYKAKDFEKASTHDTYKLLYSSEHNAVALFPGNVEHPNLPNVHCKLIMMRDTNMYAMENGWWASFPLQLQHLGCLQRTSMRLKKDSTE